MTVTDSTSVVAAPQVGTPVQGSLAAGTDLPMFGSISPVAAGGVGVGPFPGNKLVSFVSDLIGRKLIFYIAFRIGALFAPEGDLRLTGSVFTHTEGGAVNMADIGRDVNIVGGFGVIGPGAVGSDLDAGKIINDTDHIPHTEENFGGVVLVAGFRDPAVGGIHPKPFPIYQRKDPFVGGVGGGGGGDPQDVQHQPRELAVDHTVAHPGAGGPGAVDIFRRKALTC